ncbi:MAG TPA: hypothetical protein VE870_14720, partial [Bacteroidales bacterium]|nr:hypothetical protein [Bacteroidales bacterium]
MPDPFFSGDNDKKLSLQSALMAVVEILNYDHFLQTDRLHELHKFYEELTYEVYHMRLKNYGYGFEVIQPEINIVSDRIYFSSRLYLEDDVPELNMMVFKIFTDTLNL